MLTIKLLIAIRSSCRVINWYQYFVQCYCNIKIIIHMNSLLFDLKTQGYKINNLEQSSVCMIILLQSNVCNIISIWGYWTHKPALIISWMGFLFYNSRFFYVSQSLMIRSYIFIFFNVVHICPIWKQPCEDISPSISVIFWFPFISIK